MAISVNKEPLKLVKGPKSLVQKFNDNADLFRINRVFPGTGLVVTETTNGKIIALDPSILAVLQPLLNQAQQSGTGTGPATEPTTTVPGINTNPILGNDGLLYKNGQPYNGNYNGVNYTNGEPTNGWGADGNYYTDGVPTNDVIDGVLYYNGQPFSGTDGSGITYKDGVPVNGLLDGLLYENGKPVSGQNGDFLYYNGVQLMALPGGKTKINQWDVLVDYNASGGYFAINVNYANTNSTTNFFKIHQDQTSGNWQAYSDYNLGAPTIFAEGSSFSSVLTTGVVSS